ncbi:hypothetical protein DB30_00295 [Enhygromyxa salina]|uniref:Uncharacterized protein n=1 Tax=Enhygromyxa salina TaxID=215803 RepID=A0A0C2DAS2_9BACT|nr:hypothetical protein DB30_00295 [Enhygromyxa salina]
MDNSTDPDRQAAVAALAAAIELHTRFPGDTEAIPESVLEARVVLVRLYLAIEDASAAQEAMDDLIRTARGQTPPVRTYGLEVTELYEARKRALEAAGTATLEIVCEGACAISINERQSAPGANLLLGTYRVWVKGAKPDAGWTFHEVELVEPDGVVTITYEDPNPPAAVAVPAPPVEAAAKRMLPRAVEIAGAATGVGLLVVGAVLLSLDGKCSKTKTAPTAETTVEACGDTYESTVGGVSLLGVGGGLLVVSGVMLTIDEVQVGRAKGRQVTVAASFRF